METSDGFTLIETILYIALFAIVIGGGMVASYQIIQATDANYNHIIVQEEANFLFRKIDWALTGATSICSASGSNLAVTKISPTSCSTAANVLVFDLSGSDIRITRGVATPVILNSSSISVSNLLFVKTLGLNGRPDSVAISFTLTTTQSGRPASQSFSMTRYLRK